MTSARIDAPVAVEAGIEDVPVLISGCGPVGLTMSILLSRQGIRNLVVEKRETVSTLPRARGITARSVEIFTQWGLGAEVDAISLKPLWMQNFIYTQTLAGEIIGRMPTNAMAPGASAAYTPCDYKVGAQDRIDPMLYRHATGYRAAEVRFDTELLDFDDAGEQVVSTIRRPDGSTTKVRSSFLVAADGAKSLLRRLAGIGETGRENLRSFVNNHVRADLSRFTEGREGTLIWTLKPGLEGVFQMLDGDKHWAVQIQFDPLTDTPEAWTEERVVATLRAMIGYPAAADVTFEVLKTYTYTLSAMISQQLRKGRLLLVGDAAHQIPPYGGFGMNTGLQTAHNLGWKLGAVLRGEAPLALLDTFDRERREVAERVCQFGRVNAGYVEKMMAAIATASSADEQRRLVGRSKQYGNWLGLDIGVHYQSDGAFVPDDVPVPAVDDPVIDFVPHAKPGHRAPHLWVRRGAERVSTVLLFELDFVLLAGESGAAWVDAARSMSSHRQGPSIRAYRVASDGDLVPEADFCALYGITATGAVLVRPDGHVAYRVKAMTPDPAGSLQEAIDQVLQRHPSTAALSRPSSAAAPP